MCLCYNCCGDGQQFSPHFFPWLQNPHACPEQGQRCHLLVAPHPHELGKLSGPSRAGRGSETLALTCKPFGYASSGRARVMRLKQGNSVAEVVPERGMGRGKEGGGGLRTRMPQLWTARCSIPSSQIKHPGPGPCWKGHCFLQGWWISLGEGTNCLTWQLTPRDAVVALVSRLVITHVCPK